MKQNYENEETKFDPIDAMGEIKRIPVTVDQRDVEDGYVFSLGKNNQVNYLIPVPNFELICLDVFEGRYLFAWEIEGSPSSKFYANFLWNSRFGDINLPLEKIDHICMYDQYCISWDESNNPPYPECEPSGENRWHFHCLCGKILIFTNFAMDWLDNYNTKFSQIASYCYLNGEEINIPYRPDLMIKEGAL